jgi:hypothetical protein
LITFGNRKNRFRVLTLLSLPHRFNPGAIRRGAPADSSATLIFTRRGAHKVVSGPKGEAAWEQMIFHGFKPNTVDRQQLQDNA